MIAERLTQLTPSGVDFQAVRSDTFKNHSPLEIAGAMAGLSQLHTQLVEVFYLGSSTDTDREINLLEIALTVHAAGFIKDNKGMTGHIRALVYSELRDILSNNTCEVCGGKGHTVEGNKLLECSNCKTTGKAKPSLATKSGWYAERRCNLDEISLCDWKKKIHEFKNDYANNRRQSHEIFAMINGVDQQALKHIAKRLR